MNFDKIAIICFGASGSGKSTFANILKNKWHPQSTVVTCEADEYFCQHGEYKFNPRDLGKAHLFCQNKFKNALDNNVNLVIVSNTSTRRSERDTYINLAKEKGYLVFSLLSENVNETKDVHGLEEMTLLRQENNIFESLKLR